MPTEPQPGSAGSDVPDGAVQEGAAGPFAAPAVSNEASPDERRATAPLAQPMDASGALKASRDMPEPDSLGG